MIKKENWGLTTTSSSNSHLVRLKPHDRIRRRNSCPRNTSKQPTLHRLSTNIIFSIFRIVTRRKVDYKVAHEQRDDAYGLGICEAYAETTAWTSGECKDCHQNKLSSVDEEEIVSAYVHRAAICSWACQ